ncbi:MAG: hypothetical protein FWC89_08370 [Defluviitaleaceae bacterium]|nr:hypothetical protein [Defluviitaleaceae bacterium]
MSKKIIALIATILTLLIIAGCNAYITKEQNEPTTPLPTPSEAEEIEETNFDDSENTPEGEIDFSVVKSINENMPPFVFNVLGGYRMFKHFCCPEPTLESGVIDTIRITTVQGELIQEIGRFLAWRYGANESNFFGLHFADYNFDGYLDIAMNIRGGGNRDGGDFYYWLWDKETEQFVFHNQLSNMRGNGNITIHEERQQLVVWFSHAGGRHHTFYEHNNGIYEPVEIFFWEFDWLNPEGWNPPEGDYNVMLTRIDLIENTTEVFYEYWS